ncbi:VWA domain-containing protein [Candidatus Endomicrobiellum devescovinae]|uniref:vWA domain-containing protein n=1 Tax=Candidatus Endomicrobiellum devescovinae TaxID=3242322 RepID=UPI003594392E
MALLVSRVNFLSLTNVNLNAYKIKNILIFLAFFFIIIALARPQFGYKKRTIIKESSEIVISLDVSRSMLAQDLKPNRLEKAKDMVLKIVGENSGEKIGIIVFAGSAMWQCPMTYDSQALKMFLRSVETTSLPIGGTQISDAITLASKAVEKELSNGKIMVLISDGEDHDSGIKEAINKAKKAGLKIIAVGIGTPNGSPIPVKDESGIIKDYIKDRTGQIVVSKINANLLKSVASETGGKYFDASVKDISGELSRAVRDLEKNKNKISERDSKIDRFQIFLFVALLLLFIELLFPVKRLKK